MTTLAEIFEQHQENRRELLRRRLRAMLLERMRERMQRFTDDMLLGFSPHPPIAIPLATAGVWLRHWTECLGDTRTFPEIRRLTVQSPWGLVDADLNDCFIIEMKPWPEPRRERTLETLE